MHEYAQFCRMGPEPWPLPCFISGVADIETEKELAANKGADEVQSGMLVGIGSGQTAAFVIQELSKRIRRGGLYINVVVTSQHSADLAEIAKLSVVPFDASLKVDITIDGADEIGPGLTLNKGGAGALLREKVLAHNSKRLIIVADSRKPVQVLGKASLSVEVLPFGWSGTMRTIREKFGVRVFRRLDAHEQVVLTEQNNYLLDCLFERIAEPETLSRELREIPGVLEHGLFLGLTSKAIIARGSELQELGPEWDGSDPFNPQDRNRGPQPHGAQ